MVLEMSAVQRPRRLAAINSQKKSGMSNDRDQPKTGTLVRRKSVPAKKNTAKRAAALRSSATSSESGSDAEDEEQEEDSSAAFESAQEESEADSVSEDDDDNYGQAKSTKSTGKKRKTVKQSAKVATKKVKAAKVATSKKAKINVGPSRTRRGGGKDELPINKDNKIFNALQDGENARTTAEDWISYYQDNQPAALAQFVNFIFRCCACNATIDEVQVDDVDNAVETLEEVQKQFKEQNVGSYPLTSRAPVYRRFRRSLSEIVEQIFSVASETELLEDQMMIDRMLAWIATLSSSPYRAIRHTSTTFALMMTGQIARLNQEARKHFEQASKLRDAEKSAKASTARIRKLNEEVHRVNARRQILDAYHKELDETIFIHRYRDSDPMIRADCMEELGRWMRLCPGQFLSNAYFKYLAWELSDESAAVRLTVIQSLQYIYSRQQTSSAVTLFVERVMARMIEIAVGDVDVGVRVAMIQALLQLEQSMPIEDESQRDQIARQIFDEEAKVRVAAAQFVVSLIEDKLQEGSKHGDDTGRLRFKLLAECMHRWTSQIDTAEERAEGEEHRASSAHIPGLDADDASRITLAYSALWTASEELRDIKPLLDLLQTDHTGSVTASTNKRAPTKKKGSDCILTAEEETLLIDLLVAMLQKAHDDGQQPSKASENAANEESADVEMTKDLIPVLSTLLTKYKTETHRISAILLLPKSMRISAYLEQEKMSEFETLWDHLIDQFERHAEGIVIERAASAMSSLNATVALSAVNEVKLSAICESTAIAVKESVPSFSVLANVRAFAEEDRERLTTNVVRMQALCRHFDLTLLMEETDSEQDGSIWDILLASAQRSTSLRAEESTLIRHSLATCSLYVMWKVRAILQQEDDGKEAMAEALSTRLQPFLSLCERIVEKSVVADQEQANVQIEAFKQQIDLYILLANVAAMDEQQKASEAAYVAKLPVSLRVSCSPTTQAALASYVEAAADVFRSKVQEVTEQGSEESFGFLRGQDAFVSLVAHYIGAIRIGIVDIRNSATLLSYYGRMGILFDACLRVLVEAVREVGITEGRGKVAGRVILDALTKAHVLRTQDKGSEVTFVNFAKLLSSCLVVRGSHLAILRSIDGGAVREMHERAIEWTLEHVRQGQDTDDVERGLEALSLLKGLAQLTISLSPRDALQIKAALQRTIASKMIKIPGSADKPWDALHSYEKRLITIASKSDSLNRHGGKTGALPVVPHRSSNEAVAQEADEDVDVSAADGPVDTQRPRPRPRQTAESTYDDATSEVPFGLTQQDETAVDSILGFAADESLPDLRRDGENSLAFIDQAGFDLSQDSVNATSEQEASHALLFRGMADESQTQEAIVRPSRRARPSQSMREEEDEDNEDSAMNNSRRKRNRRS